VAVLVVAAAPVTPSAPGYVIPDPVQLTAGFAAPTATAANDTLLMLIRATRVMTAWRSAAVIVGAPRRR